MPKTPTWNLSDLFSSLADPAIAKLTAQTSQRAKNFREKYRGKFADDSKPTDLVGILKEYENILSDAVLPLVYGELIFSVDSLSAEKGAFLQKMRTTAAEIFSELIFLELEISAFSEEKFEEILASDELAGYKHFFEKLLAAKKHRLSEKEEQIIQMKDLTGKQAFGRLFEQELAGQKFMLEIEGNGKEFSQSEILNLLYSSSSQDVRRRAAEIFTQGLSQKESVLVFVMNVLAEDKKIADKLHDFSFPEQSRHLSNETDRAAVEAMAKVVEDNYFLVQQYYQFKRQVLGLEKIYDYDRYAPVKTSAAKYTFAEAQKIVLDAFAAFDPNFGKIAEEFFEKSWIDAALAKGKRGGAYCEGATPQMHPYVFLNFTGSANDVATLAHELGHAIHFELARQQTLLNYDMPLTLAETASIFAETLVFKKMVDDTEDREILLGLYMHKIESIFASVPRQISMYRFEQDFHRAYREQGELASKEINVMWRRRQEQMFGSSVVLTEGYDNWWMYISHFVHTPFYVYAYAFGELLAFGLLEKAQEFPQKYSNFLAAAGGRSPQDLAALFDINLEDKHFWESSFGVIGQYLGKAKDLHSEINKVSK